MDNLVKYKVTKSCHGMPCIEVTCSYLSELQMLRGVVMCETKKANGF